ncbi:N-acetylmuramoyl-L-alanine amidase [Salinicola halimionae]|uniref:N-acetylmuramoyl-L-alanine amidase n=1 Tax=Salinicola halimionae TaxID=1949081 RepID=UPI001FD96BF5|nr:N-acetylmuramoyl-L-alanine amidase [Salinicola halimionae]
MIRHLGGWLLLAMLVGCAGSSTTEVRDGYIADHAHLSHAYNQRIRYLILHYTDSEESRAMRTLLGPDVSSHYLVPRYPATTDALPSVWQLVDEKDRAWHAGISAWEDRTQLNDTSVGVEIVNRGPQDIPKSTSKHRPSGPSGPSHGVTAVRQWEPYPEAQIEAVIALAKDIIHRYHMPPTAILGHSDIAPSRKIDPGPRFPWKRLHDAGIGAWPKDADVVAYRRQFSRCSLTISQIQQALSAYGYAIDVSGELDNRTRDVLRAFQMHFRPANYAGQPDDDTAATLWALLARYRPQALIDNSLVKPTGCEGRRDS